MNNKPLVTFVILAYNQEQFIRAALDGALLQTYDNLEIILSDDCSTDQTFEMMQYYAAHYCGPHKIILNRNVKNLGIGAHINFAIELSHGELIVIAAGDDISLPERVDVLVKEWQRLGCPIGSLYSSLIHMDEDGTERGAELQLFPQKAVNIVKHFMAGTSGATSCWHRRVFEEFGPLRSDVIAEDMALGFRAAALGGIHRVRTPLVKYRHHCRNFVGIAHESVDDDNLRAYLLRHYTMGIAAAKQFRSDLCTERMQSLISETERQSCLKACDYHQKIYEIRRMILVGTVYEKLLAVSRCFISPFCIVESIKCMVKMTFPKYYLAKLRKARKKKS